MNLSRISQALIWCAILLTCAVPAAANCLGDQSAPHALKVQVVPQLLPTQLYAQWSPLLEQVGHQTGQCFELSIPASIPEFERALLKGTPDFAFVNPYHAVMARGRQGYIPLVMDGKDRLSGMLTVPLDSPIKNLTELEGKTLAFPSPNAFAASLLLRAHLARIGVNIKPRYVQTHANVYRAVALAEVSAGGGVNTTLLREQPTLRAQLRVLYETPSYAPHPVVAHPRVSASLREAVASALVGMASKESGRQLLNRIQMPAPTRANYERDFAPLERLGLDRFVVMDER